MTNAGKIKDAASQLRSLATELQSGGASEYVATRLRSIAGELERVARDVDDLE